MKIMTMPTQVGQLGTAGTTDCIKGNTAGACTQNSVATDSGGNMGVNVRKAGPISPCCSTRNVPPA